MSINEYVYLEHRPHRWRRQLHVRGRPLSVSDLLADVCSFDGDAKRVSDARDLPMEAVLEAIDYGRRFPDVLAQDAAEEIRRVSSWLQSSNEEAIAEWRKLLPLAREALGDERSARQWLRTPNLALGNELPAIYAARSPEAFISVRILLEHIRSDDYGAL